MTNTTEIYAQTIRQLPSAERLRLATLILEDLNEEQTGEAETKTLSALEVLEKLNGQRVFDSAEKVDEYLKAERESWDN